MNVDFAQILTQSIGFLLMLWILKRFMWKPILGLLDARQKKIKSAFDDIEDQKKTLKAELNQYHEKLAGIEEQSRIKIQQAIDEGKEVALDIQKQAQLQAKKNLDKAKSEISQEIVKAKVQLKNDLVKTVMAVTEKLLLSELDQEKHKILVSEFVEKGEWK